MRPRLFAGEIWAPAAIERGRKQGFNEAPAFRRGNHRRLEIDAQVRHQLQ